MDLEQMRALLAALQEARYAGVRSVSYDGKTIAYGSDAELATAINDLETRIATAQRSYAAQKGRTNDRNLQRSPSDQINPCKRGAVHK